MTWQNFGNNTGKSILAKLLYHFPTTPLLRGPTPIPFCYTYSILHALKVKTYQVQLLRAFVTIKKGARFACCPVEITNLHAELQRWRFWTSADLLLQGQPLP